MATKLKATKAKSTKKVVKKPATKAKTKPVKKKVSKAKKIVKGGKKKPEDNVKAKKSAKEKVVKLTVTNSSATTKKNNKNAPTSTSKQIKTKTAVSAEMRNAQRSLSSLVAGPIDFVPYEESSNEEYMNELQNTHFAAILHRWKKELIDEIDKTVLHMKDEAANYADPNDRATQEEEFSLELRTRDRERKLIKKIDEALDRIKRNEYGYCESCGVEIGIKRLEARPTATLCIDCKTLEEIKEKQMAG